MIFVVPAGKIKESLSPAGKKQTRTPSAPAAQRENNNHNQINKSIASHRDTNKFKKLNYKALFYFLSPQQKIKNLSGLRASSEAGGEILKFKIQITPISPHTSERQKGNQQ